MAEQAVAAATAAREQPHGLLRLTLPQTLVVSPVGKPITKFQQAYPELCLDVRVTSLQVDPMEEGFDIALRIGNLKDSNLVGRKIREVRFQAMAAPAYLKRRRARRKTSSATIFPSGRFPSPSGKVFVDFLIAELAEPPRRRAG
jgi:DNA-binding transcriptional LysR family regulator